MPHRASRLLHVSPIAAAAAILGLGVATPAAAARSAAPAPAPAPYVVAIDPGHGGSPDNNNPDRLYDSGAVGHDLVEKDLTLNLALRVRKALEADGVRVVMTRTTDTFVDLSPRLATATAAGAKLYVSIHFNYFEDPSVEGSLVMYPGDQSAPFAQLMAVALQKGLGAYGIASDGIVLNPALWIHSTVPTVTVEGAYLTNGHDAAMLKRPAVLDAFAASIRSGVEAQAPEILQLKKEMAARRLAAQQEEARLAAAKRALHVPAWLPWGVALALATAGGYALRARLGQGLALALAAAPHLRRESRYPRRRSGRRRRGRANLRDLPSLQPRRR